MCIFVYFVVYFTTRSYRYHISSNITMIHELWIGKDSKGNGCGAIELSLDYYVMAQTWAREGKWKGNRTSEWVSRHEPLHRRTSCQQRAELSTPRICCKGTWTPRKLSSAHVSSYCNRALLSQRVCFLLVVAHKPKRFVLTRRENYIE
jgi:hypothetical protein